MLLAIFVFESSLWFINNSYFIKYYIYIKSSPICLTWWKVFLHILQFGRLEEQTIMVVISRWYQFGGINKCISREWGEFGKLLLCVVGPRYAENANPNEHRYYFAKALSWAQQPVVIITLESCNQWLITTKMAPGHALILFQAFDMQRSLAASYPYQIVTTL